MKETFNQVEIGILDLGGGQTVQFLENSHLQSLESLCKLLVREVELLSKAKAAGEKTIEIKNEISLADEIKQFEINLIKSALFRSGGKQKRAARLLGLKLTTLNTKIKRHKISVTDFS